MPGPEFSMRLLFRTHAETLSSCATQMLMLLRPLRSLALSITLAHNLQSAMQEEEYVTFNGSSASEVMRQVRTAQDPASLVVALGAASGLGRACHALSPLLVDLALDQEEMSPVRGAALTALTHIGDLPEEYLLRLVSLLDDHDRLLRQFCLLVLQEQSKMPGTILTRMIDHLQEEEDDIVRSSGILAVTELLNKRLVRPVRSDLGATDATLTTWTRYIRKLMASKDLPLATRGAIIQALLLLRPERTECAEFLRAAAMKPDTKRAAACALLELWPEDFQLDFEEKILRELRAGDCSWVWALSGVSRATFRKKDLLAGALRGALEKCPAGDDGSLAYAYDRLQGKLATDERTAAMSLLAVLKSPMPQVQVRAVKELSELQSVPPACVSQLRSRFNDDKLPWWVRERIRDLLRKSTEVK